MLQDMATDLIGTGVPGFDVALGGGLPVRQAIVVTGAPGSGKTLLCSQLAFALAARGQRIVVATLTSEPHDKLLQELTGFSFFDQSRVGDEVFFVSAYPALKKGPREARELLLGAVATRRATLLFIDGLRALRDLWRDEARLREFMYDLCVGLSAAGCNGVFSTEYALERLLELPEATTVDGIISLSVCPIGPRRTRRLEVVKLRGRPHLSGLHSMHIGPEGVGFTPRLESITAADTGYAPPADRAEFGLPALDALVRGGLPEETATLIIGSTGVGKTLLSLHWAAAGARRGDKALFVSFFEPAASLVSRARGIGLELEDALAGGRLAISYVPPLERDADLLIASVLEAVDARGARRLVIDGIQEVERALADPDRTRPFYTALLIQLRRRRVTTVFTTELTKLAGEIDLGDTPVSLVAENLLFARHVELRGRVHRILSILKMRSSGFDSSLCEFELDQSGLRVLAPVRHASGLLTGIGRPIDAEPGAGP
jgi:circadian clock protein KaiC